MGCLLLYYLANWSPQLNQSAIRKIVDWMTEEGLIYWSQTFFFFSNNQTIRVTWPNEQCRLNASIGQYYILLFFPLCLRKCNDWSFISLSLILYEPHILFLNSPKALLSSPSFFLISFCYIFPLILILKHYCFPLRHYLAQCSFYLSYSPRGRFLYDVVAPL